MRRRWLLTTNAATPSTAKKDFDELVFPLNDSAFTADHAVESTTYCVSAGSTVIELPSDLPSGLQSALQRLADASSSATSANLGIAIRFSSVWWFDNQNKTICFWCWNKGSDEVYDIELRTRGAADAAFLAGERVDPEMIRIMPQLAQRDAAFKIMDERAADAKTLAHNFKNVIFQTMLVIASGTIYELALRGTEEDGLTDSEFHKDYIKCPKNLAQFEAAYHHNASGRSFFAVSGPKGGVYEYRPYTIDEVYITLNSALSVGDNSRWIDSWKRGAMYNIVQKIFYREKPNRINAAASLRSLMDLPRAWFRGSAGEIKFKQFCESSNDTLYLACGDLTIYYMMLQPPLIQTENESILRYTERPTIMSPRAVLTRADFSRSILECLELSANKNTSNGGGNSKKLCEDASREVSLVGIIGVGHGAIEILLDDATRVTCSTTLAQRAVRWSGRADDPGKTLHDSLRLRSDPYVWSYLQLNGHHSVSAVMDPPPFVVTHVRWAPSGICEKSVLYQRTHQWPSLLEAPTDVTKNMNNTIVTAASSGVSHSGAATTSGCWLALRCASQINGSTKEVNIGHLVVLNGREWEVITSGTRLAAWQKSRVGAHHRKLLESERDIFLWSGPRRIKLAAVISQLQKIRAIPVMISAIASSYGIEGMQQLSLLQSKSLGGLVGLTSTKLFGARKNAYSDILKNHLPGLQNLIDAMFKDLNFSLPFMPHGGLQVQDPPRLVAALERYATLPLNGLKAWAELATELTLSTDHSDAHSNLVRSIRPPDAAWVFYRDESHRTIDMCWHYLATQSVAVVDEGRASSEDDDDLSGYTATVSALKNCSDKSIDTCCRLLFSLTSLGRMQEGVPPGANVTTTGQRETFSLLSLKRFILQLIADFNHCPLFEIALDGILVAHAIDSGEEVTGKSNAQNAIVNNPRKRTLRERDNPFMGSRASTDLSINLRLGETDYHKGLVCCQSLQRAFQIYDSFMKTQVSLDVRNKVQEDAAQFADAISTLDVLGEIFQFLILLAKSISYELGEFNAESGNLMETASVPFEINSGQLPQISVDPDLLYQLAQLSFATLVGNTIMDGESSLIRRWFDEGSLLKLVSPTSLVKVCPNLFDKPSLEWSAAVEPLLACAEQFDRSHFDRRRQQTEKVQGQNSVSSAPPVAGALDYLFDVWKEAADKDNLKDLDICLPLPSFARDSQVGTGYQTYGGNSEVLNIAVGGGLLAELRKYALEALQTFVIVGRDKGEYYKDAMFQQLLDILFRLHTYDFFHLTLATWADVVSRYHIWSRLGSGGPSGTVGDSQNDLPSKISQVIHRYLTRLANVVITTEKIIGWDLLIALIRQLTSCKIPLFTDAKDDKDARELQASTASLQPFEQPIAFSVFEWMFAAEQSALNLTALPDLLKSPHITAWLDLQNQGVHAAEAHAATTKVSEVYLCQKNYGQALNMMLTKLESQPTWLNLPVQASMLAECRLSPESMSLSEALTVNGSTLSCMRGLIDPCIAADMRGAFRKKLLGQYQASDDWKLAIEFVEALRETGSFPIDHRIEMLLKCLVLSVISDADSPHKAGGNRNATLDVRSQKTQPTQTTSLLSSQVRRALTQNDQPHYLLDQYNKVNAVGDLRLGNVTESHEDSRGNSSLLLARRSDTSLKLRVNDGRRLSPRCSQIFPSNIGGGTQSWLSSSQGQLAGTSPVLQPQILQTSQYARNAFKKQSVFMLGDEDAEKLKLLGSSRNLVLDKVAEALPLPSYVSKNSSGLGVRRSETDRLRHAQTKLLSQWAMVQDMTEYITFLLMDNSGEGSLSQRINKLMEAQKTRSLGGLELIEQIDSRAELLQNTVSLLMKLLHSHFATPYALIDCMLKLAVANAKVAPMNLISVLECWGQLDERRLRLTDAYKLLPPTLSSLNGDIAICMVVANSTVAERLVLAKRHKNYSLLTDMALRIWNVFALSVVDTSSSTGSERHTERRILLEGNASSPLRLLPGILWRFMTARLSESSEQEDQPNWLNEDVRGLSERKTRLNIFLNTWEECLLGEHEAHVFVYESCVRTFIWDLIGLTRCPTTAADYETIEELLCMSYSQPNRIINVLKSATHWLFAVGMTLLHEINPEANSLKESHPINSSFADVSQALCAFFGFSLDNLLLEGVFNNVVKDLIDLINWLSHISLPGLADCWTALAGTHNAPDNRYIAPVIQQAVEACRTASVADAKGGAGGGGSLLDDQLTMFFGRAFFESGVDEISPILNGSDRPKWLLDAKPSIPGSVTTTTSVGGTLGMMDLVETLIDSVEAVSILATHAQSTSAVHTLNTVLKNYKCCVIAGGGFPPR